MPNNAQNQQGFSLIELMISIVLGLFVVGAITSIFVSTTAASNSTMQSTRLNQEMRSIMEIISSDLRRAGYFSNAHCTTDALYLSDAATTDANSCTDGVGAEGAGQENPFAMIEIDENKDEDDCVLFSYDYQNDAGTAASPDGIQQAAEHYGYKRDENSSKGFISRRTGGKECDESGWRKLSNPEMSNITRLTFDSSGSRTIDTANGILSIRKITITMSGELVKDPDISLTIQNTVSIPNDRYCLGTECADGI